MTFLENKAAEQSLYETRLGVRLSIPQNLSFYKKQGYEVVEEHEYPDGTDGWYIMRKKLIAEFGEMMKGVEYRSRAGAYAILFKDEGKLAVVRVNDEERFFLPGGGVEGAESHETCLRRECEVEIGFDIDVGDYLGTAVQYLGSFKTKEDLGNERIELYCF